MMTQLSGTYYGKCINCGTLDFFTPGEGMQVCPFCSIKGKESTTMQSFETGAVRSSDGQDVRYDLITPVGLRRLAETYAEGAKKYSPRNWEKGIPASNLLNHALRHINMWMAGDTKEDHLAHAVWNLMAIMHFEEDREELIDIPNRVE